MTRSLHQPYQGCNHYIPVAIFSARGWTYRNLRNSSVGNWTLKAARTIDKLINQGLVTRRSIIRANRITLIKKMELSVKGGTIDCGVKQGWVKLPEIKVSFYDSRGEPANTGSAYTSWKLELQVPDGHERSFSEKKDRTKKVVGSTTNFNDVRMQCYDFKHMKSYKVFKLNVKVVNPSRAKFSQEFSLAVIPMTVDSMEVNLESQEVDCSLGNVMNLQNIKGIFKNQYGEEVFVGSINEPWTVDIELPNNHDTWYGDKRLPVRNEKAVFSNLKVNCKNYRYKNKDTKVVAKLFVSSPTKHKKLEASTVIVLAPKRVKKNPNNNWQRNIQFLNDDGSIRILADQNVCLQTESLKLRTPPPFLGQKGILLWVFWDILRSKITPKIGGLPIIGRSNPKIN